MIYIAVLASVILAGATLLLYVTYLTTEFHESARSRRRPNSILP
jgi:hypothetical protein